MERARHVHGKRLAALLGLDITHVWAEFAILICFMCLFIIWAEAWECEKKSGCFICSVFAAARCHTCWTSEDRHLFFDFDASAVIIFLLSFQRLQSVHLNSSPLFSLFLHCMAASNLVAHPL